MTKCRHCGNVTGYFVFDVCGRCQADGKDSQVSVRKGDKANIVPLTPESREHIDVMEYTARWNHRCGQYPKTLLGGCDKPAGHGGYCAGPEVDGTTSVVFGMDRGMPIYDFPCSCGRTIRGTDRDRGKRCTHELEAIRDAAMAPIPQSMLPTWLQDEALAKPPMRCPRCNSCLFYAEQKHNDRHGKECAKPPTIREWLGDRVSELGRWAEVLREQPVPAGEVVRWEWWKPRDDGWQLRAHLPSGGYVTMSVWDVVHELCVEVRWWRDQLQMALFTRHPDVQPEPKPAVLVCEDQYEVMP